MVSYHPEEQRFQAFKPNRETVINEKGATPERVAELIGKDAAERLMKAPKAGDHHYLEGENLNIGGEGMKGFYDKMVPSFLNQFGKKYGAKVGQSTVKVKPSEGYQVRNTQNPNGRPTRFMHATDAANWRRANNLGEEHVVEPQPAVHATLHHFPITPEMREDVTKNGVPLYAEGGDVTRLYRGGYNPEPYTAKDMGVYGGLFASGAPEPASSHGPYLHYTDIPTDKILTHYALNYEVPHEKVRKALIKAAPHVKKDKELFNKLHDLVVNDRGQDLRHLDGDEIYDLLRKEEGADADNEAQRLRGQIAKDLGYHAVELEDEHGTSFLTTPGVKFKPHVTKAEGGSVKEKVTVSPSLDQMQYELISMKHSKKVK